MIALPDSLIWFTSVANHRAIQIKKEQGNDFSMAIQAGLLKLGELCSRARCSALYGTNGSRNRPQAPELCDGVYRWPSDKVPFGMMNIIEYRDKAQNENSQFLKSCWLQPPEQYCEMARSMVR